MPARKRKQVEANDGSYGGLVLDAFDRLEEGKPTDEQKAAIAKAIFDNDYGDMKRLKASGRWPTPQSDSSTDTEGE